MMWWNVKKQMPSGSPMSSAERRAQHEAEIGEQEVGVFEQRQHADIERDHERQHRFPFHPPIDNGGEPVDRDRGDQEQDEGRAAQA